ncbi:16S rRNA (cytidine(1402)-2'-O)-methyltransferase [Endozoicomonas sp. SCSIO W0465]|uniref:16S rRNA (cytidine(1402)-2'-O)-methyltransferase n=1 Tax=Endozoicomonas sp. SCSIO W0465 TaxID=2918516 RepID=UPI002075E734|nr:16S rRNA (cytidine(1402)-2'-O)-methyltransferase [Endozoicomonas sp. SCSIO W0465]USE34888.1 16S rRNA (cytidine(1402)-2'-O)-methyltransferase [Endozoicomonas sp. SCSIO W0465]
MSDSLLYIVSTPIGNLGDMTPRAIEVLRQVDVIAAEDTRHSKRLMNHFGIDTPLVPCHDHNERHQAGMIVQRMKAGETVALISDAGTPLISDPGFYLVRLVRDAGFRVVPIPGACAFVAALSVSGLPTDRFYFEGFLPAKGAGRRKRIEALAVFSSTWGVYESPHRIMELLDDLGAVLGGDRYIALAREITKTFETVMAGTVAEIQVALQSDVNQQRGEFVVLVEGYKEPEHAEISPEIEKMLQRLLQDLPIKKAAAIVADLTGLRKKDLYDLGLGMKNGE